MSDTRTSSSLETLRNLGFESVGRVVAARTGIAIEFQRSEFRQASPVLYAFVVGDEVAYVGKSSRTLAARMQSYQTPGPTQSTNIRVNQFLRDELARGLSPGVWAWRDPKTHMIGGMRIDLAAGLEATIIERIKPRWNGGARGSSVPQVSAAPMSIAAPTRSGTHAARILEYLASVSKEAAGRGVCDDCLAGNLAISPRQSVNMTARKLEQSAKLRREKISCARCGAMKICNRLS